MAERIFRERVVRERTIQSRRAARQRRDRLSVRHVVLRRDAREQDRRRRGGAPAGNRAGIDGAMHRVRPRAQHQDHLARSAQVESRRAGVLQAAGIRVVVHAAAVLPRWGSGGGDD